MCFQGIQGSKGVKGEKGLLGEQGSVVCNWFELRCCFFVCLCFANIQYLSLTLCRLELYGNYYYTYLLYTTAKM